MVSLPKLDAFLPPMGTGRVVSLGSCLFAFRDGCQDPEERFSREPGRAPPRHAHGDLTSLAPHESPGAEKAKDSGSRRLHAAHADPAWDWLPVDPFRRESVLGDVHLPSVRPLCL